MITNLELKQIRGALRQAAKYLGPGSASCNVAGALYLVEHKLAELYPSAPFEAHQHLDSEKMKLLRKGDIILNIMDEPKVFHRIDGGCIEFEDGGLNWPQHTKFLRRP